LESSQYHYYTMIELILKEKIALAFKEIYALELNAQDLAIELTNKQHVGDFTFVVFPFIRHTKQSPEITANAIGEFLLLNEKLIAQFNIIKGFLNLEIADDYWLSYLEKAINSPNFGESNIGSGTRIMIEYSSPNTNKPQHLGHVRNNLLGASVSNILSFCGFDVVKANLINDRGIHICKSMLSWKKFGNGETPASSGIKGDHLVGKYYVLSDKIYRQEVADLIEKGWEEEKAKKNAPFLIEAQEMLKNWEEGDAETVALWTMMNEWVYDGFEKSYARMGITFDKYYYESDTYLLGKKIVEEGLKNETFFKKFNGSIWVDLKDEGLDEKLLLRADGTSVYITQDLGTAQLKYNDFKMDKSIYVVGNEQDYHFKVLQLILKKLNKPFADGIYHLSYGMVDLPSGRMKTREGTVVDADDLMKEMHDTAKERTLELGKTQGMDEEELEALVEMLGMGALKYFLLKVDPTKRMLFDPKESIDFQGNTGPFIQYTFARINSILRSVNHQKQTIQAIVEMNDEEKEIIKQISLFQSKCEDAAKSYSPALVAGYAYDLAKVYNRFYHEHSILGEQNENSKAFRINLSLITAKVIKKSMALLGIDVPDRM
jgi:arginyl-tRNA synthetase